MFRDHPVLNRNAVGDDGAQALAESSTLTHLRVLGLFDCALSNAGIEALTKSPILRSLERLDLSCNVSVLTPATSFRPDADSDAALLALAASPHLPGLKTLRIAYNKASEEAILALVESPHLTGLQHLELQCKYKKAPREALEKKLRRFGDHVVVTEPQVPIGREID